MKEEHYAYVSEHFRLSDYHGSNHANMYDPKREGIADANSLKITTWHNHWCIRIYPSNSFLFVELPSKELAQQIVEFIQSTDVLFI